MFKIFKLEFKRIIKNPLFYILGILIISFAISNMGFDINPDKIVKPTIEQGSYGTYPSTDMEIIKPKAVESLISEYMNNRYTTYPYGFYKSVRLSDEKDEQIGKIISALTGETFETIEKAKTHDINPSYPPDVEIKSIGIRTDLSNEEFKELMETADTTIGKGSHYGEMYLIGTFGVAERDYDGALEEYNLIIEEDRISGAYARYFSDYIGIVLGMIPVFLAVGIWYLDKSSKSQYILYVRQIKSKDIVWGRYLAMVISLSILILAMASYYNIKVIKHFGIEDIDILAYYKYTIIWLIPTMMISLAVGTLLTIVTDSPVGVVVQLVWFFLDISSKFESMQGGGYGMSLMLRHNTVGNTSGYLNNVNQILVNRIIYVIVALVMVLISEKIYDKKRVGKLGGVNVLRKAK